VSLRHLNPNVGASFTLSFLVVATAAVALHPAHDAVPNPAAAASGKGASTASTVESASSSAPADERPTTTAARPRPTEAPAKAIPGPTASRSQPASPRPSRAPESPTANDADWAARSQPATGDATAGTASAIRATSPRRPPGKRPASPFADVREGETLTDVARRVYGSADAAQALWLANRDQIDRPDIRLRSGSVVRTP
jgi:nucleoid-associated protein YgaU